MEKPKLVTRKPTRLFVFGCSVTRFFWVTWPDIIAKDLDCDLYNFGFIGNSNELIFNTLMQADSYFKFNEDDLVMICWTGITRESRFFRGEWIRTSRTHEYFRDIETKYFDNDNVLLKSLSYQKAATDLLDYRKCQAHQVSMIGFGIEGEVWNPISNTQVDARIANLYKDYVSRVLPSIYGVLFDLDFDLKKKKIAKDVHPKFKDLHPLPIEIMQYLQSIFNHDFKQSTLDTVRQYHDGLVDMLKSIDYYDIGNGDTYHPWQECLAYADKNYIKANLVANKEFKDLFFI